MLPVSPIRGMPSRCLPAIGKAFRSTAIRCGLVGCGLALGVWSAGTHAVEAEEPAAATSSTVVVDTPPTGSAGGMFLPAADGLALWRQTLAAASMDWPIVQVIEPDFYARPPRPGRIESAWVEPRGATPDAWPPRRQRAVIIVTPTGDGAWIDATVESQSLAGDAAGGGGIELVGTWQGENRSTSITPQLAARMSPATEPVYSLPPLDQQEFLGPRVGEPPWAGSRYPRISRAWTKIVDDYRNFYSCDSLVCITAAFGAGAVMANTGFDTTMQSAWQRGVEPTSLGTFFSGCKDIGEGRYALPIFGVAAATGLALEGSPVGDAVGGWGSRSLRIFVVGAPPLYALQWATGASRPDESSAGSQWHFFNDNNGVSGHAFVGAVPFLAAADMVESPLLKGTLYVCSTFVGFSRMTDNAHYPSQVFLGWYLAWASSMAVSRTETHFAGMELRVVPLPAADLGGLGLEARW